MKLNRFAQIGLVVTIAWGVCACKKDADMLLPDAGSPVAVQPATPVAETAVAPPAEVQPLAPLTPAVAVVRAAPTKPAPIDASASAAPLPPQCAAANVMLANGRPKEFEVLKAACIAKGGHL